MKYKELFIFEISKIFIAILNIIFLVEQYPELSFTISIVSIITSGAMAGAVAGAVAGAGAVVMAMAGDVAVVMAGAVAVVMAGAVAMVMAGAVDEEEDVKPKKIKRCSKCKQEVGK